MDAPTPLPPLSLADLFVIIGEQQARIWQLTRVLEAAQAAAQPAQPTATTTTRWPPQDTHWLGSAPPTEATG